jgi:hypothetical protein
MILLSATDCSSMLAGSKAGGLVLVIGSRAKLQNVRLFRERWTLISL